MATYTQTCLLNAGSHFESGNNTQTTLPGLELTGVDQIQLSLTGIVYQTVDDALSEIANAVIVIYSPQGTAVAQSVTDSNGAYSVTFSGQTNVNYVVTASCTGFDSQSDVVIFTDSLSKSLSFLLKTESSKIVIYGYVTDTLGNPVPYANISVTSSTTSVTASAAQDGSFMIYDGFTTDTTYSVTASQVGYNGTTQTITIPAGSTSKMLQLQLTKNTLNFTSIAGRVTVAGSSPVVGIAGALVGLYAVNADSLLDMTLTNTVMTNEYGVYTFIGINPDTTYVVKALKIVDIGG